MRIGKKINHKWREDRCISCGLKRKMTFFNTPSENPAHKNTKQKKYVYTKGRKTTTERPDCI